MAPTTAAAAAVPDDKVSSSTIQNVLNPMQELVSSLQNQSYEWRCHQLRQMKRMLHDHQDDFAQALQQDLGKHMVEAVLGEVCQVHHEIDTMLTNLHRWMKPTAVSSPALVAPAITRIVPIPLCHASSRHNQFNDDRPACLVIAPSNYPCSLALQPAVGAMAAGNPVVIKPSELCPAVAACLEQYCHQYFEASALRVVPGGIPVTTALLQKPWGLVFFTGSQTVGRIVATAAALTLTPVVLELGGKCPAYVDGHDTCPFDLRQVANRIVWAKTFNAGQTCAAVDTLIVHEQVAEKLIPHLVASLQVQFGTNNKNTSSGSGQSTATVTTSDDSELGRLVSPQHAQRNVELIQEVEAHIVRQTKENDSTHKKTRILVGGSQACRPQDGYVSPTIILNPPADCRMMREEIFGPILPVVTVPDRAAAIDFIRNQLPGTPLCLYVFTTQHAVFEGIRQACPAGNVMRNDCLVLLGNGNIPFGGLGHSGYGAYHGKYTFDVFSHAQPIMYRPCGVPGLDFGMLRYHPFGGRHGLKSWLLLNVVMKLPNIPVLHCRIVGVVVLTGLFLFALMSSSSSSWLVDVITWMPCKQLVQRIFMWAALQLTSAANWLEEQTCSSSSMEA